MVAVYTMQWLTKLGLSARTVGGDTTISSQIRQLDLNMMTKPPAVRHEDGLTPIQCLQKRMTILQPSEWGGDLELRLLAIGIQRELHQIVLIVAMQGGFLVSHHPCQK